MTFPISLQVYTDGYMTQYNDSLLQFTSHCNHKKKEMFVWSWHMTYYTNHQL